MIDVVALITSKPDRVHPHISVLSCYDEGFVAAAKKLGGRWDGGSWIFERTAVADVEAACRAAYGSANPSPQQVDELYEALDVISSRILAEADRYLDRPLAGSLSEGTENMSPHEVLCRTHGLLGIERSQYRRNPASAPTGLLQLWDAASHVGDAKPRDRYDRAVRTEAGELGQRLGLHQLYNSARELEQAQAALARFDAAVATSR